MSAGCEADSRPSITCMLVLLHRVRPLHHNAGLDGGKLVDNYSEMAGVVGQMTDDGIDYIRFQTTPSERQVKKERQSCNTMHFVEKLGRRTSQGT